MMTMMSYAMHMTYVAAVILDTKDRCDALSSRLNLCPCRTPGSLQVLYLGPHGSNGPTLSVDFWSHFLIFAVS